MIVGKFTLLTTRPEDFLGRALLYAEVSVNLGSRLTVAEAAGYFGLTKANINKWYVDGHLTDVTLDGKGHRLYLLDELLEAERATRRHPNSSRSDQRKFATV